MPLLQREIFIPLLTMVWIGISGSELPPALLWKILPLVNVTERGSLSWKGSCRRRNQSTGTNCKLARSEVKDKMQLPLTSLGSAKTWMLVSHLCRKNGIGSVGANKNAQMVWLPFINAQHRQSTTRYELSFAKRILSISTNKWILCDKKCLDGFTVKIFRCNGYFSGVLCSWSPESVCGWVAKTGCTLPEIATAHGWTTTGYQLERTMA